MLEFSMAGYRSRHGKSKCLFMFKLLFILNTFLTLYNKIEGVEGHAQAFIQTDNELQYLVDGVSIQMHHQGLVPESSTISFTDNENIQSYTNLIGFHPPSLDFKLQPVGIPFIKKVVVHNPSSSSGLHMLSISGSTVHFHCSFFLEKIIEPGGNTTFDVVFLSREQGSIENTLFIHTSVGSFRYKVQGEGVPNPYRLRPFLGVRMPLNSSYNPLINMHNPHGDTLQVTEMYSSGGDLHLELVNGESEAPVDLWAIQPYETKPVMRASFIARKESNHTSYIRIKTNSSGEPYLVIPVEVEVSSEPGIYSPVEVLDFGVIRSDDLQIQLTLSLLNSGKKPIQITNVISTPVNDALKIEFKFLKILPDTFHPSEVAELTFIPAKVVNTKQCSGKIVVKSKNNQFKLSVPYVVHLLHGSLQYNKTALQFFISPSHTTYTQVLNITNFYNATIVFFNFTLFDDAQPYFKVLNFKRVILKPRQSHQILTLKFKSPKTDLQLSSFIRLHSNVSYFDIPLICYSGKLKTIISRASKNQELEFGTLGMGEKRSMTFKLQNLNQVKVVIQSWNGSNLTKTHIKCISVQKNTSSYTNFTKANKTITLAPFDTAVFQVEITAPSDEGKYFGIALIKTIYEVIKVVFTFTAAKGSLNSFPEILLFNNTFPGKISSQPLHIHSTFSQPLKILSVKASTDSRFYYHSTKVSASVIKPETKSNIGKLYFDPKKLCKNNCYASFSTDTSDGNKWLSGISLPPDVGNTDGNMYNSLGSVWKSIKDSQGNSINVTLQLDTEDVQGFLLQSMAYLKWPKIASKTKLKFPLTQIGNISVKDLLLENPANHPLVVQVVMLPSYPNQQMALDLLTPVVLDLLSDVIETENLNLFILKDLEKYENKKDNPIPKYRSAFEANFGIQAHKDSIVILMKPGAKIKLKIGFVPFDDRLRSSLILIRNNLTVIDTVVIEGQGGHGEIKLGNKRPSLDSTLLLEMTEKHLTDCGRTSEKVKIFPSRFTVKRPFTARNTGELPVYISNFYISGSPCQGYGFRILNCNGFLLKPNASFVVDIAFTPDFTLTRIEQVLTIETSLSSDEKYLNYSLVATVPANMLKLCAQSLPSNPWEQIMYYSFVSVLVFMLFVVCVAAYLESERILHYRTLSLTLYGPPNNNDAEMKNTTVFDLKNISSNLSQRRNSVKKSGNNGSSAKQKDEKMYTFPVVNLFRKNRSKSPKNSVNFQNSLDTANMNGTADNKDVCKQVQPAAKVENSELDSHANYSSSNYKKKSRNKDEVNYSSNITHKKDEGNTIEKSSSFKTSWSNIFKGSSSKTIMNDENLNLKDSSPNGKSKSDSVDDKELYSPSQLIEIMDKDLHGKNWSIKMKNKKKSLKSMSNHDANLIKTLVKKSQNNEEETSSTTTETSNPDSDNSTERENKLGLNVKTKHKASNKKSSIVNKYDNKAFPVKGIEDDGENHADFELSTKSKAHKKIKIDSSKVYGGDILKPSTLELPYKLKPVKMNKDGKENKHCKNNDCSNTQKSNSKNKNKSGLNELNGLSGSSSRSSSYSSIVSSNGEAKATKINKKSENNNKHPGTIGQRPPSLSTSTWTAPESSLTNTGILSSSDTLDTFILPPIQESNSYSRDVSLPPLTSFTMCPAADDYSQSDNYQTFGSPSPWEAMRPKPMTIMQTLQAERRQRMELYRKQQACKSDWPGFDVDKRPDTFWEPCYFPHINKDKWITTEQSDKSSTLTPNVEAQSNEETWNNSRYNSWNPVSHLWPTTSDHNVPQLSTDNEQSQSNGEYAPFSNLMSIWDPNHNQSNSGGSAPMENAWSNSFFMDNAQSDME